MFKYNFTPIFGAVKRFAAISFIFLLSAQCIFKIGIISYFDANRDYIAEVLCVNKEKPMTMCYGQCFLDRNLDIADEDASTQIPASTKVKIETSVFIGNHIEINVAPSAFALSLNSQPQELYNTNSADVLFHPPC